MLFIKRLGALSMMAALLLSGCTGCSNNAASNSKTLSTPAIAWAVPTPVPVGTALSAAQLNASSSVAGSFVYSPPAGTVEASIQTVQLTATFTPSDTATYSSVVANVPLQVTAPRTNPTLTWATPTSITVGTALSSTQLNATASVPGTFVYTPSAGTVESTLGNQILSVTFTPTDTVTYAIVTATVTLAVVAQIVPAITWPTPAPVQVGTVLSATQLNATANAPGTTTAIPGTLVYTPPAGTVENTAGNQTLSVKFTPTDLVKYSTATATVVLSVTNNAPAYTFNNVQIVGGGYVTGIIMHPAQQGLMYARTDIGGAYRWNSTTKRWVPLLDFLTRAQSNLQGVESIGVDPSNVNRLYLATGTYTESFGSNGAMLVSADQGATFTIVPVAFKNGSNDNGRGAGERLAVDPNLGSTILFGTRLNGLYKSADSGATWNQVTSFPVVGPTSGVGVVFEDFIKSSSTTGAATKTIYAGVSSLGTAGTPSALYVSTDAGTTWAAVPNTPTGLYISHGVQGQDGNLYFTFADVIGPNGVTTGAVYQYLLPTTSNPGGTWTNITPPRANGYQGGYGGLAMDPQKPGTIMVSTLDHYYPVGDDLWRSNDYGKTWYSINTVGANRDVTLSPWVTFGGTTLTNTGNWPTALAIDPFDSNHVVHGSGQTILASSNMVVSDSGTPSNWAIGSLGLEETAVLGLISPPSGPANLLSLLGDLGGFQHTTLVASPPQGQFKNPIFNNGTGLDFAQANPTIVARVGTANGTQFGAYSTDSAATWTPFAGSPAKVTVGAGSIAVSADGSTYLWSPQDSGAVTSYSTDKGTTWTASTGAPSNANVFSDRVNPKKFYIYVASQGTLYTSTNSGVSFAASINGLPTNGSLNVAYDAEGSLYLASNGGLYHATLGATSFAQINTVQSAYGISEGAAQPGSTNLTLYLAGQVASQVGVFRSIDSGATWVRIDDATHEYGYWNILRGDPRVFGRVYFGTGGRGIIQADSPY